MEPAAPVAYVSPPVAVLRISKITKVEYLIILISIFFKFWRDRSRLNQNEILQENMHLTVFFKLCKICILLHRCNLKMLANNRFERIRVIESAIFVKIQHFFVNVAKSAKIW